MGASLTRLQGEQKNQQLSYLAPAHHNDGSRLPQHTANTSLHLMLLLPDLPVLKVHQLVSACGRSVIATKSTDRHLGILAGDAAEDGEWEGDEGPDDKDDADGAKGQRGCGAVHDGDRVQEGERGQHGPAKERRRQQHIAHPVGAAHHLVRHRRHVACHPSRQRIQHLHQASPQSWYLKLKHFKGPNRHPGSLIWSPLARSAGDMRQ